MICSSCEGSRLEPCKNSHAMVLRGEEVPSVDGKARDVGARGRADCYPLSRPLLADGLTQANSCEHPSMDLHRQTTM